MAGDFNSRPLEPGCLGTGINPGMGAEIGGPRGVYASVAKIGASSTPTGTILRGEILKSTMLF